MSPFDAAGGAGVSTAARVSPLMQPLTQGGLFAWTHEPAGETSEVGVVLVSPLGRDARCVHAPMRMFADQLALAGYPTLRYDHLGCGDSLDLPDPSADALACWLDGLERTAELLRSRAGVRRVVLAGIRAGAALAVTHAALADGLILLAPVLSGRSWLRRLRFAAQAAGDTRGSMADDAPFDAEGLWLNGATAASLAQIDLATLPAPEIPVFLAAQNRLTANYGSALVRKGAAVETQDFKEFDDLFIDAHSNLPPRVLFGQAIRWLERTYGEARAPRPTTPRPPARLEVAGGDERPVRFGSGLWGVLCEPRAARTGAPAVLVCNTGGDPRAGIGGLATQAARRLALKGFASLRFDFAGLGDSPMDGEGRCHVYETPREADMDAAVSFLDGQGHAQSVVVGLCAGAYHGLRASWRDQRIIGVFAVSPVKLQWLKGESLVFGKKPEVRSARFYLRGAASPLVWRRLLLGRIDVPHIVAAFAVRRLNRLRERLRLLGGPSPASGIEGFGRRGGHVCLTMGREDASLDEIEIFFGPKGERLKTIPGAALRVVDELDHGLALRSSRQIALEELEAWLDDHWPAPETPARDPPTRAARAQ